MKYNHGQVVISESPRSYRDSCSVRDLLSPQEGTFSTILKSLETIVCSSRSRLVTDASGIAKLLMAFAVDSAFQSSRGTIAAVDPSSLRSGTYRCQIAVL